MTVDANNETKDQLYVKEPVKDDSIWNILESLRARFEHKFYGSDKASWTCSTGQINRMSDRYHDVKRIYGIYFGFDNGLLIAYEFVRSVGPLPKVSIRQKIKYYGWDISISKVSDMSVWEKPLITEHDDICDNIIKDVEKIHQYFKEHHKKLFTLSKLLLKLESFLIESNKIKLRVSEKTHVRNLTIDPHYIDIEFNMYIPSQNDESKFIPTKNSILLSECDIRFNHMPPCSYGHKYVGSPKQSSRTILNEFKNHLSQIKAQNPYYPTEIKFPDVLL